MDKFLTDKIRKHVYEYHSQRGRSLVLKNPYNSDLLEIPTLIRKRDNVYLIKQRSLMTKAEELYFNRSLRTEKFYYETLGAEKYKKLDSSLPELLIEYNSINFKDFYMDYLMDETLTNEFLAAQQKLISLRRSRFKDRKLTLRYFSKEIDGIQVLNKMCKDLQISLKLMEGNYLIIPDKQDLDLQLKVESYLKEIPEGKWGYKVQINKKT